ncbi:MAG: DedA family protein [Ignavibacteriaceae bacterium]|nr:DedA family protein [Ignavibacteriaceae bacterium]
MFEYLLSSVSQLPPATIYLILFVLPFIENLFPPSPSDVIVVLCGSIIATGGIDYLPALIVTIAGSEAGFLVLFYLGIQTDKKIIQAGKLKFISQDALLSAENWFRRFGFWLIIFNRFFPGLRSVIAYFAGVSELEVRNTVIYSTISAFLWNTMLITMGFYLGNNIEAIDSFFSTYTNIFLVLLGGAVLYWGLNYFRVKREKAKAAGGGPNEP